MCLCIHFNLLIAEDSADSFEPVKVKRKSKNKKSSNDGPSQKKRKRDEESIKDDVCSYKFTFLYLERFISNFIVGTTNFNLVSQR